MTLRLPTEAEWEYACRAGTTTVYHTGDSEADLARAAWYARSSNWTIHHVGQRLPNAFGLYDMHGSVYEWVEDDHHDSYSGAPSDGSAWVDSPRAFWRVLRGGCWYAYPRDCRSALRVRYGPDNRDKNDGDGFRVVIPAGPR